MKTKQKLDNETKGKILHPAASVLDKYHLSKWEYEHFKMGYCIGFSAADKSVSPKQVLEALDCFDRFYSEQPDALFTAKDFKQFAAASHAIEIPQGQIKVGIVTANKRGHLKLICGDGHDEIKVRELLIDTLQAN